MAKNLFNSIIENDVICYRGLGNEFIGGTSLNALLKTLSLEITPNSCSFCGEPDLLALVIGDDNMFHPLFLEDCSKKQPYCMDYYYNPERLPAEIIGTCALDVFIVDQIARAPICHLCFEGDEFAPECWQVFDDFAILRSNIVSFMELARRIQYAQINDLLA